MRDELEKIRAEQQTLKKNGFGLTSKFLKTRTTLISVATVGLELLFLSNNKHLKSLSFSVCMARRALSF